MQTILIHTDGGTGQNALRLAWVRVDSGREHHKDYKIIEVPQLQLTNNEAEYLAIIQALKDNQQSKINIFSDSQLVVGHLTKHWQINHSHLLYLFQQIQNLIENRQVNFYWISRKHNKAGNALEVLLNGGQMPLEAMGYRVTYELENNITFLKKNNVT